MWMVAMETKITHFKCISYHAKIIKFSFGHKDFHITDFITKCQILLFFFICFRQVSIEQIQTSIIHIAPCSQEIIDNENPCISYHAKIIKFSFGHKDFHITDFITKCQILNW
jgi:hypothetical protein